MNTQSNRGFLSEIKPKRLGRKDQDHCWLFAVYSEYPADRTDGREYRAFLFRNDKRTVFGLKEYWDLEIVDFRNLATKVIQDKDFRESLISTDSDLPKIWKRH